MIRFYLGFHRNRLVFPRFLAYISEIRRCGVMRRFRVRIIRNIEREQQQKYRQRTHRRAHTYIHIYTYVFVAEEEAAIFPLSLTLVPHVNEFKIGLARYFWEFMYTCTKTALLQYVTVVPTVNTVGIYLPTASEQYNCIGASIQWVSPDWEYLPTAM